MSSTDDLTLIQSVGYEFIVATAQLIPLLLAYGFFFPLAIFSISILFKQGLTSLGRKILLVLTILLLLSYTLSVASVLATFLVDIKAIMTSNLDQPWSTRIAQADELTTIYSNIINWPLTFNILAGDAVVVWRAWIIWSHSAGSIIPRLFLLLVMLANIAVNICSAATLGGETEVPNSPLNLASLFLSFGVNFIGTVLIYIRAWQHHQTVKVAYNRRTHVEKTLALLVESGAIVGLLQLVFPILLLVSTSPSQSTQSPVSALNILVTVMATVYEGVSPIYPVAVIVLINMQRSVVEDMTIVSNRGQAQDLSSTLSVIQFSDGLTSSNRDLEGNHLHEPEAVMEKA